MALVGRERWLELIERSSTRVFDGLPDCGVQEWITRVAKREF